MLIHVSYQPRKEIAIMKERAVLHSWSFNDGRTNLHLKKMCGDRNPVEEMY